MATDDPGEAELTRDRETMRRWADEHGAVPVELPQEGAQGETRQQYRLVPEDEVTADMRELTWEEFSQVCDDNDLVCVYYEDRRPSRAFEILPHTEAVERATLEQEPVEEALAEGESVTTEIVETTVVEREIVETDTIESRVVDTEVFDSQVIDEEIIDVDVVDARVVDDDLIEVDIEETSVFTTEEMELKTVESEVVDVDVDQAERVEGETIEGRNIDVEGVGQTILESEYADTDIETGGDVETLVRSEFLEGDTVQSQFVERRTVEEEVLTQRTLEARLDDTEIVREETLDSAILDRDIVETDAVDAEIFGPPTAVRGTEAGATEGEMTGEQAEAEMDQPETTASPGTAQSPPVLTEDDQGKRVVDRSGETIGMIEEVQAGTAYVDPHPGLVDKIKAALDWGDVEEDTYPIDEGQIEAVTDDEVRLSVVE